GGAFRIGAPRHELVIFCGDFAPMPVRHSGFRPSASRRLFSHAGLLAGVSAIALMAASPAAWAGDILHNNRLASQVAAVTAQQVAAMQQAQAAAKQASNSLARATQAIQAMQAAQNAARNLALQTAGTIPNGLQTGGLVVAPGANPGSNLWQG